MTTIRKQMVLAEKCSKCKLKQVDKCEGQEVINVKNKKLLPKLGYCEAFIDIEASKVISDKIKAPYPITSKKVKK